MGAFAFFCALVLSLPEEVAGDGPRCRPFSGIYENGRDLCEKMWGEAFFYEVDETQAYTMWFAGHSNPNDLVTARLGKQVPETCLIQYFHRDKPDRVGTLLRNHACPPWQKHGCCRPEAVASANVLKQAYGRNYEWDRCGPLQPSCEAFFVQEACFYECDPNVGLYRKFPEAVYDPRCDTKSNAFNATFAADAGCKHNSWEIHRLPIKASYCDAWFEACKEDFFCATEGGNYFSCAMHWSAHDAEL